MKKEKLIIVKIGGNVIDDEMALKKFLKQFSKIKENKLLVHGGGKLATELSRQLNIPVKMLDGKRITDKNSLKIATMVYAGFINKTIVSQLQANKCNAIGLSGADGNCIKATKRSVKEIDYGFVGDLKMKDINHKFLSCLLTKKLTPVLSAITHDAKGNLLNTNADTISSFLAMSLSKVYQVQLLYCFEKKGVLGNSNDELTLIDKISAKLYAELKIKNQIHSGMVPKMDNAFKALKHGVNTVQIGKADHLIKILNKQHENTTLVN